MKWHIEAGKRRTIGGDLVDCYILVDDSGDHIAATKDATIVDYGRAEAICKAINAMENPDGTIIDCMA